MNLLVTNTRHTQAYAIIRALRPYANKIVTTMEGDSRLMARLSHAANSRLVDRRYYTPFPDHDWRRGKIQKENTEIEESYIRAVLRICEKEKIDTIFPSFDPQVYVFSKNKKRFEKLGILIPIPDYETVITPLDKYRTIQAAMEVGFPCPKTHLLESEDDLRRIADEMGFPLLIKPRFTSGGRGTEIVKDLAALFEKISPARGGEGTFMIQEYIPGSQKQQFHLLLDKKGELKTALCPKTNRLFHRLYRNSSVACESSAPHPYAELAAKIPERIGWWGGITVQTKIDSRDGLPKLMEMNPRLGHRLWYRTALGINEPLRCLKISRGEDVETVRDYCPGTMLLSPVEDFLALAFWCLDLIFFECRTRLLRRTPVDPLNPPIAPREMLRSYKESYFGGRGKLYDPYFRYFLDDPKVSLLWWSKYLWQVIAATRNLGK